MRQLPEGSPVLLVYPPWYPHCLKNIHIYVYIYIYITRLNLVSSPYRAAPASGPAMYMPQAQPQPGNAKDQSEWDLFWGWWFQDWTKKSRWSTPRATVFDVYDVYPTYLGHSPNSKPVLSIHLSIYQSNHLSISLPIPSYLNLSISIYIYLYLSILI